MVTYGTEHGHCLWEAAPNKNNPATHKTAFKPHVYQTKHILGCLRPACSTLLPTAPQSRHLAYVATSRKSVPWTRPWAMPVRGCTGSALQRRLIGHPTPFWTLCETRFSCTRNTHLGDKPDKILEADSYHNKYSQYYTRTEYRLSNDKEYKYICQAPMNRRLPRLGLKVLPLYQ